MFNNPLKLLVIDDVTTFGGEHQDILVLHNTTNGIMSKHPIVLKKTREAPLACDLALQFCILAYDLLCYSLDFNNIPI